MTNLIYDEFCKNPESADYKDRKNSRLDTLDTLIAGAITRANDSTTRIAGIAIHVVGQVENIGASASEEAGSLSAGALGKLEQRVEELHKALSELERVCSHFANKLLA